MEPVGAVKSRSWVVEQIAVSIPLDPYLSLRAAAGYCGLSIRSLRGWLDHPERPLPCYRVGGKILLRRSELDRWLSAFRRVGTEEVNTMVDGILREIQAESNSESRSHPCNPAPLKGKC